MRRGFAGGPVTLWSFAARPERLAPALRHLGSRAQSRTLTDMSRVPTTLLYPALFFLLVSCASPMPDLPDATCAQGKNVRALPG